MKNHKHEIWSCDFLVQHTALFSVVYIFIIMEISTRKIIGFNVTCNPTLAWVKRCLRHSLLIRQPFSDRVARTASAAGQRQIQ